jgi:oligoribonuclease
MATPWGAASLAAAAIMGNATASRFHRSGLWSSSFAEQSKQTIGTHVSDRDPLRLIWIDLEMTGLKTNTDHIIEIATVVTDKHLNVLAEGPVIAVHQPDSILDAMDDWNRRQHASSGLSQRVRDSTTTVQQAEARTLAFLSRWVDGGTSPMCGNSICQDRRFLAREMPELERYFHYRNLDVSTLKELARRWNPDAFSGFQKSSTHLALDDIRDSIRELDHYRAHFLRLP